MMKGDYTDTNLTEEEIEEMQHKRDLDDWERAEEEERKRMEELD